MTLTTNNQLQLLQDLLNDHSADCCGDVAQYQQIKRVVRTLMSNSNLSDEQLLSLLPEIYHYGQQGETAKDDQAHVQANKDNISAWVNAIQQTNEV